MNLRNRLRIVHFALWKSVRIVRSEIDGNTNTFADAFHTGLVIAPDFGVIFGRALDITMVMKSQKLLGSPFKGKTTMERRLTIDNLTVQ